MRVRIRQSPLPFLILPLCLALRPSEAAEDWEKVEAVLEAKCYDCHGGAKTKGGVDLKSLAADPQVGAEFKLWELVLETVETGEMPPPNSEPLAEGEAELLAAWVGEALDELAAANAGDPGPVTMRRLTNAEYDRTLRDLAGGRDYGLAREFQTDGGGGEGFANTGDTLFLSPSALDKYFSAARQFADHASVMPGTGIVFHDHRVGLRGPEQVKAQAEQGLYVWYQQKAAPHLPGDFDDMREGDYMLACWKHRHFGTPLAELAAEAGLHPAFLENWWRLVNATEPPSRFLDLVRVAWRELPGPSKPDAESNAKAPREAPEEVRSAIAGIERDLRSWNNPQKPGTGVQRRQQDSDGIRPYPMSAEVKGRSQVHLCFGDLGDGNAGDVALVTKIEVKLEEGGLDYHKWLRRRVDELRARLAEESGLDNRETAKRRLAEYETALALFGRHPHEGREVEPHVLAVEAPRIVTLPLPEKGVSVRADTRLDFGNPSVDEATIQWTMTADDPPDVTRILPGVLTIWKIQTPARSRTMADFSVMRVAFPDMFERRLAEVAKNLYRSQPGHTVYYFSDEQLGEILGEKDRVALAAMRKDFRLVSPRELNEAQRKEFDSSMVSHLHRFAAKAWRRPLADGEKEDLAGFYRRRVADGLDRESAVREGIVRVLVSPHFLFKAETLPAPETTDAATDGGDLPLSPWELASRLSYFLWSSLPDWPLREAAADCSLADPDVIAAHARRMLRDPRSEALAEEFAGQWLQFAGFREHDGVDAAKFPEMTPDLRADMEREAIEFFARLFRDDRPVRDVVAGRTTFLNERLAAFYGVPGVEGAEFREVDVAGHHRGGLLGMGAVLTKTSRPTRTSPVLRGEFLHAVVLGHSSPPPPPDVPELKDDGGLAPASLREALMKHREDQACSVCHDRIDPLGFALESFDAIGRFRPVDEAGQPIDDTGELRDGTVFEGFEGLREYLGADDGPFVAHFSRKLLGYALGRQVLPSDRELVARMSDAVHAEEGRVSAAVVEIVTSRQFRNRRSEPPALATHP